MYDFQTTKYISAKSNSQKSFPIVAHWPGIYGTNQSGVASFRVGQVVSYFCHTLEFKDPISREFSTIHRIIARVEWYMDHPQRERLHPPTILCAEI